MKKVLKFLDENYPALILIVLWSCYEYSLMHFLFTPIMEIFNNLIERPSFPVNESVAWRIHYCVLWVIVKTVGNHIPPFIIILIFKYMAKNFPYFNKKVLKILSIATIISFILFFCIRLYCDLWWNHVI